MMALRFVVFAASLVFSVATASAEILRSPRPIARPGSMPEPITTQQMTPALTSFVVSPLPRLRPQTLTGPAQSTVSYRTKGSVCGVSSIRGVALKAIPAKIKGCGLSDPVRVTEISGVKLSSPATIDCTTAKALRTWIDKGAKKAVGRKGGGLSELKVVASYACRTRNNLPGAKVSEHGRGRAVDIAGFTLESGEHITVLKGWNKNSHRKILKKMHKAACGPFGTVLGPNANKYHKDHFHFDTARYRSGSYCR
jgi:hypothetical protein